MVDSWKSLVLNPFYEQEQLQQILRADGKTPEVKYILKISASWQEISFLSNFNILVGMLQGLTDLVESSEDMMRATSCLSESLKSVYKNI